jgi:predicted PurR-regulated permease PerM
VAQPLPRTRRNFSTRSGIVVTAGLCIAIAALYFAQDFLKPFALAVLFCFALAPVSNFLERRVGLNRPLSVIATMLLTAVLFAAVGWIVGTQVSELSAQLPQYRQNIERKVSAARSLSESLLSRAAAATRELRGPATQRTAESSSSAAPTPIIQPAPNSTVVPTTQPVTVVVTPQAEPFDTLRQYFSPVLTVVGHLAIVVVFVLFMLIQREDLRDRLIRLLSRNRLGLTTDALDDAASRVSRYLLMLCLLNASFGVTVAIGFWIIGIPAAALWGLLCGLLRFVPYVGVLIGAAFPLLLSVAVSDGWSMPFWTLALIAAAELTVANVFEPVLYGRGTGVTPVAVIISAAFWAWLWGAQGLLMATPLTVCLAVAGKHVKSLRFLSVLLGDEPALSADLRYYQRLLAEDELESRQLLQDAVNEASLLAAYEEIALPALITAEREARRGWLAPDRFRKCLNLLREQSDRLAGWSQAHEVVKSARGQSDTLSGAATSPAPLSPVPLPPEPIVPTNADRTPGRTARLRRKLFSRHNRSVALGGPAQARTTAAHTGSPASPHPVSNSLTSSHNAQLLRGTYPALKHLPEGCHPRILILPARDEPDELAGRMLAHVLAQLGYDATTLSIAALAGEMVETALRTRPDLIIVSTTPPAAVAHARYLLKRLDLAQGDPVAGSSAPPVLTVVWTRSRELRRIYAKIGRGDIPLATNLLSATQSALQLTQPCIQKHLTSPPPTHTVNPAASPSQIRNPKSEIRNALPST